MCDTLCVIGTGFARFAKNSDRPHGEVQLVEPYPRRPPGGNLRTQYLEIEDTGAHALVGSRPDWLWGFEHGVNEFGLAIGNERLFVTDDPVHAPGLIGMDLVRLGLERARDAGEAIDVIAGLLAEHGQGGSCAQDHDDPYSSSFLITDPTGGWILETTGRSWVAEPVAEGAAISNRIVIDDAYTRASSDIVAGSSFSERNAALGPLVSDQRLALTRRAVALGASALDAAALAGVLRDHGGAAWGDPRRRSVPVPPPTAIGDDFSGVTVCQHLAGVAVTAAAMIAELAPPDAPTTRLWTSVGAPCVSIFVPSFFPYVPAALSDPTTWSAVDAWRRATEQDPARLASRREALDALESALWEEADEIAAQDDSGAQVEFAARAHDLVIEALRAPVS